MTTEHNNENSKLFHSSFFIRLSPHVQLRAHPEPGEELRLSVYQKQDAATPDPKRQLIFPIPRIVLSSKILINAAVEFVKFDLAKPQEMQQYRKLVTQIKATAMPVANQEKLIAGKVCRDVKAKIKALTGKDLALTPSWHRVKACTHCGTKPRKGSAS